MWRSSVLCHTLDWSGVWMVGSREVESRDYARYVEARRSHKWVNFDQHGLFGRVELESWCKTVEDYESAKGLSCVWLEVCAG